MIMCGSDSGILIPFYQNYDPSPIYLNGVCDHEYLLAQYRGVSLTSYGIKFITWAGIDGYSHSSLYRASDANVIEAWGKTGVRRRHFGVDHTPGTRVDLYTVPSATVKQWEGAWEFGQECADRGDRYSMRALTRFLTRAEALDEEMDWSLIRNWFCSQLVFVSLAMQGVFLAHKASYKMSPVAITTSPLTYYYGTITV